MTTQDDDRPVEFLRGIEPGPQDVAAAQRCPLVHEEVGGADVRPGRWVIGADVYGRPSTIGDRLVPVQAGERWLNPGMTFLEFDAGMPLDHMLRQRPPDERGEVVGEHYAIWVVRGLPDSRIVSSPYGVGVQISTFRAGPADAVDIEIVTDLQNCLAAAQAHQRMLRESAAREQVRAEQA